ncbi:MAG TPA: site-specific DNA-methyltransferase, partial [Tissierella sp.]|nr:site-specific DNA-methyltransferase [Tissierella sp.]
MDKLNMRSKDMTKDNIEKIEILFPNVITEIKDNNGNITKAIDFQLLQQELSCEIVEGDKERYQLTWPGKKEAILMGNTPIDKTLRPVKEDSVEWDSTENLYIEGDNLEVLKLLQESYLNKIKCIYIDPPYNTGNDFIYVDD